LTIDAFSLLTFALMLIAQNLRKTNIAEYILYMWQVEDLLRVCSFDPEQINRQLVSRFDVDGEKKKEISDWYLNLALMMEKEHVQEKGHLQVITNLVNDLNEFHLRMIQVQNDQEYCTLYKENQDDLLELSRKSDVPEENEVNACLVVLYGYMLLKLKNSEISEHTQKTVQRISRQIGHLSARYIQFEKDEFEF
jgi:hypothetical protein